MESVVVRAEVQKDEHDAVVVVTLEWTSWQLNVRAGPDEWRRLSVADLTGGDLRASVNMGSAQNVGKRSVIQS
jgi:hypothetical protein